MSREIKDTVILGGHFGNGIQIFQSGFHLKMQYGFVDKSSGVITSPDWVLDELSKEDAVELATLLLIKRS